MEIIAVIIIALNVANLYSAKKDDQMFAFYGMRIVKKSEDEDAFKGLVVMTFFFIIMLSVAVFFSLTGLHLK